MKAFASILLPLALTFTRASAALDPIVVKGSKFFFKSSGEQFYMKGVAYQADIAYVPNPPAGDTYYDPLADAAACKRDVPLLKELGTNIIRVYSVNPTKNHDECMKILDDAGIYVISDLSEPKTSINRNDPSWNDLIYKRYTDVVDNLAGYSNVMGFFAGNEVSNQVNNTDASAFVKAAVRDMKAYIKKKNYREIPVGYATNDDEAIRSPLADYFNCGDAADRADFWGYNIYSWCGDSTFEKSGYDQRTKQFSDYGIPVFFAEYGCNEVRPRTFTDIPVLYGDQMNNVFSGGIVYMFHEEPNKFGLVQIDKDGTVTKLPDFNNLKKQIANVDPKGVKMADYAPETPPTRTCPNVGSSWEASPNLPPQPDESLCQCMVKSLTCVSDKVDEKAMGELFGYICGQANSDCTGINSDGKAGTYGAFSMCSSSERLSWAFNSYYNANGKTRQSCDFNGNATIQTPVSATGTCKTAIDNANTVSNNTNTDGSGNIGNGGNGGNGGNSAATIVAPSGSVLVIGTLVMALTIAGLV